MDASLCGLKGDFFFVVSFGESLNFLLGLTLSLRVSRTRDLLFSVIRRANALSNNFFCCSSP